MRSLNIVVGIWTLMNLALTGMALGAVAERRERRTAPRVVVDTTAKIAIGDQTWFAEIEDISYGGVSARVLGQSNIPPRTLGLLQLTFDDERGTVFETPCVTTGRAASGENRGVHLKFIGLRGDRFRIVSKLMFRGISEIYSGRRKRNRTLGVIAGSTEMTVMAIGQMLRGFRYLGLRKTRPGAPSPTAPESARVF